jgi:hypothetical protein
LHNFFCNNANQSSWKWILSLFWYIYIYIMAHV